MPLYPASDGLYPAAGGLYPSGTLFAADTSLSDDTITAGWLGALTITDTSTSTATPTGVQEIPRTAGDASLSTDSAATIGPEAVRNESNSTGTVTAQLVTTRTITDVSLSVDTSPRSSHTATASDLSASSDATPIGIPVAARRITDVSLSIGTATAQSAVRSAFTTDRSLSTERFQFVSRAQAANTSLSAATVTAYVQFTGYQIRIRERAPLRLTTNVFLPDGGRARWAADDPKPQNVPGALSFSTVMPGGHEQGTCTLARDPTREYPDLVELSKIQVVGAGNQIASEGRIESFPASGGDQMAIAPTWMGYQNHLADDNTAREIFMDRAITAWQGPSVQRQLQWLSLAGVQATGPSVGPDYTTLFPSLVESLQGAWTSPQVVEAWYDGHGIPIGGLYAAWKTDGQYTLTGGNLFGAALFLVTDDTGTSYDQINPILSARGTATLTATTNRPWALIQFWNDQTPGGQDGVNYGFYITAIGVRGRHGLPLYGTADYQNAQGVLASDIMAYAINKWAPMLSYSTGPNGTIQASSFVIPVAAFLDPTNVAGMQSEVTKYELLDWAVWDGPTYYLNARNARGRRWRTRLGAAALQEAGPQTSRLWNGVMVSFVDQTGATRTYGPPGSGANREDASLLDTDPDNPANKTFDRYGRVLRRWAPLAVGQSTWEGAKATGGRFLEQQKLLDMSGQAQITGHIQDADTGIWCPAYMMRAGDQLSVGDASDASYRRVVHTQYDDPSKSCTLQLDQPPDALQALLERLQAVLLPYGL